MWGKQVMPIIECRDPQVRLVECMEKLGLVFGGAFSLHSKLEPAGPRECFGSRLRSGYPTGLRDCFRPCFVLIAAGRKRMDCVLLKLSRSL